VQHASRLNRQASELLGAQTMVARCVIAFFALLVCCLPLPANSQGANSKKDRSGMPPTDYATLSLNELEAKVRELEKQAPRGVPYDNALTYLARAYMDAGDYPEAADACRKLWQLREKELGKSDDLTILAMFDLAKVLLREDSGQAEAGQLVDDILGRLSRRPKRDAAFEFRVLWVKAELLSLARPHAPAAEIDVLDKITRTLEANLGAGGDFPGVPNATEAQLIKDADDALRINRLRIQQLRDRLQQGDPALRERSLALGRRAWSAHELLAIKRWDAYRRTNKPWPGDDPHPIDELTDFYTNQKLGETDGIGLSIPALRWKIGSSNILDDSIDPKGRATRLVEVVSRAVDAELKLAVGKPSKVLATPLEAIIDAIPASPDASGARDKLARAGKLLLDLKLQASGRYSNEYLASLDKVLGAYAAAAFAPTSELIVERDAAVRRGEAEQRLSEALKPRSPDLRGALDAYIKVLGKDASQLVEYLTVQADNRPSYDTGVLIEAMDQLLDMPDPASRLAFDLASHIIRTLAKSGAAYEALQLGRRIAARAEGAVGLRDAATQSIVTQMLSPALKFAGEAELRELLLKVQGMQTAPDMQTAPEERLLLDLLAHGHTKPALAMGWRKIKQAHGSPNAYPLRGTPFNPAQTGSGHLSPADYELLAVLGDRSDLVVYADIVERVIVSLLDTKPDATVPRADWLTELIHGTFRLDAEGARYLQSQRGNLLAYPKTLRGDCDTGAKARDQIAGARVSWLKKRQEPDLIYITMFGLEAQIERAAIDCLVRASRLPDAVRIIKTSRLASPVTEVNEINSPNVLDALQKMMVIGALPKMPGNAVTDLRAALILGSAGEWVAVESRLRQLVAARQVSTAQDGGNDRLQRDPSAGSLPDKSDSWVFDTLAALKYAPDMRAPQLLAAIYLKALWRTKGAAGNLEDIDRAFQLAQRTEMSTAIAIARMAARGVGGPDLAQQVRQLQDLEEEEAKLPLLAASIDIGSRLREIASERNAIEVEIAAKFPRYFELIKPRGIGISEVQKLLGPAEALIFTSDTPDMLGTPQETFVIVITQTEFRWARSTLGTEALKGEVTALRCGLDEEEWAEVTQQRRCGNLLGTSDLPGDTEPLPFHLGRAHNLYKALLGPFEKLIADKRLLIVPSGPLTSLPFNVLVTAEPRHSRPTTYEQFSDVAWLGTRNALVTLPAVSSLASLRSQLADQPRAPAQYAGYGNPLLTGDERHCRRPMEAPSICPSAEVGQVAPAQPSPRRRSGRRSGGANINQVYATGRRSAGSLDQVRALCPLPDTEYEISCVANHFPAADRLLPLRLREKATERDIKALSRSGELSRYRILHFATHGLLAGDVKQITDRDAEPALVLTPPKMPDGPDDDGLLMASEVAALKLNADWVVLSACNTAAGEKIGTEALSGLARSFFYAGARSLLVSHWPVYSDAAVRLATHAFAELNREAKTGRAEAMRRAMAALMRDRSSSTNAHPAVWAPFVVVGEGAPDQYAQVPVLLRGPTPVPSRKPPNNN